MVMVTFSLLAQTKDSLPKFDPTRNSSDDLKAAVELARFNNKRIILDVGGKWFIWYQRIDAVIHNTKEVNSLHLLISGYG